MGGFGRSLAGSVASAGSHEGLPPCSFRVPPPRARRRPRQARVPMSLYLKLSALAEAGTPVRVGVIGAGKFGSMFLSQAPRTPGLHVVGIADLSASRAREALARVGWPAERASATSFG